MVTAAGSSEKNSYLLVTIKHGDPTSPDSELYTDWGRNTEGFVSTPSMGVELPENSGTFDEKEVRVLLPIDAFTSVVASGLPHSPMYLHVEEQTLGLNIGEAGSRKSLFKGRITRTIKNYQGRNDTVGFFALPIKSRLDVPMGLQCNHHCAWALFSRGCALSKASNQQTGQIAAMDGKEITLSTPNASITAPSAPGGDNSRFWERGYLEREGLRIAIHIWSIADPTIFVLRRRPPDSWLLAGSASITFVPGCHKTIEDCRDVWDNEQGNVVTGGGFGGFGYAMLPYNPLFENPQ